MFLAGWHERNRPLQIGSISTIMAGILCLSILNISIKEYQIPKIWEQIFYVLTTVQALVLLIEGTFFALQLAGRERSGETLDFHRNSPQPVLEKILGMVFGATWFEWQVFLLFFLLEIPFMFLPKIHIGHILLYNLSLFMTGIFFHVTAATLALVSPSKKRGLTVIFMFIFLLFAGPYLRYATEYMPANFWSYLIGTIAFNFINPDRFPDIHGWFYSFDFPAIFVQALVQVPLILLMVRGMVRVFNKPNSPAWSKEDLLRFCFFIFLMFTGFFVANITHFDLIMSNKNKYYWSGYDFNMFVKDNFYQYAFIFMTTGFAMALWAVPSYFKRTKVLLLKKMKLSTTSGIFDDGSGSFTVMALYLLTGLLFLPVYFSQLQYNQAECVAVGTMIMAHVLAFSGFLEYYRLGRFRKNLAFFITVCVIWWVFVPVLAQILFQYPNNDKAPYLGAVSPFMGYFYILDLHNNWKTFSGIPLIGPSLIAVLIWVLNMSVHSDLRHSINKTSDNQKK